MKRKTTKSPYILICQPFDGTKCNKPAFSWGMCEEHYHKEANDPINSYKGAVSILETSGTGRPM